MLAMTTIFIIYLNIIYHIKYFITYVKFRDVEGGVRPKPPVVENFGTPLSGEVEPPYPLHRRAKRGENF